MLSFDEPQNFCEERLWARSNLAATGIISSHQALKCQKRLWGLKQKEEAKNRNTPQYVLFSLGERALSHYGICFQVSLFCSELECITEVEQSIVGVELWDDNDFPPAWNG